MRARTVLRTCYVFDFDDTIVQTDAKVHIIKNGKRIKSLDSAEHKENSLNPGETEDFSDLFDPRILMAGRKYKMWPELERISNYKKMGSKDELYILTARSPKSHYPIFNFLKREKIDIKLDNIITVGNDSGLDISTPVAKKEVLQDISNDYDVVYFYDDCEKNIQQANTVPGIRTKLID